MPRRIADQNPGGTPPPDPAPIAAVIEQAEPLLVPLDRDDLRKSLSRDRGRIYVWPPNVPTDEQARYTSVTTALKAIPKTDALMGWAVRLTAETAVDKIDLLRRMVDDDPDEATKWLKSAYRSARDRAAWIGSDLHAIAEYDAAGNHVAAKAIYNDLPDDTSRRKADQLRDFFGRGMVRLDHVEVVVYSDSHGYAGTADFFVTVTHPELIERLPVTPTGDTLSLLLDLKTGKGVYAETALQLAAYRHADWMVDVRTGAQVPVPAVDGAAVLHVTEDSWAIVPMAAEQAEFDAFLAALSLSGHLPLDDGLVGNASMRGRA